MLKISLNDFKTKIVKLVLEPKAVIEYLKDMIWGEKEEKAALRLQSIWRAIKTRRSFKV